MPRFEYQPKHAELEHFGNARTVRGVTFLAGEPVEVTSESLAAKLRCMAEFREVADEMPVAVAETVEETTREEAIETSTDCAGALPGLQNQGGEDRHLESVPSPRRRGRPPGSKNKPKEASE